MRTPTPYCNWFAALCALIALLLCAPAARAAGSGDAPLAPLMLSPERRQLIGLKLATVEQKDVSDRLDATGLVEPDERLEGYVQTRFAGWIERVFANQTYQYVRKGEPLFTIYSPELVSTEQEYLLALKARGRVEKSEVPGVAGGAASLVEAALERLKLFGVSPREISRLEREGAVRRALEIDSPMSGYIVERNALPNMYVQPETRLFAITDLSKVWVYAAVFQDEVGKVKVGDPAAVTVDAWPGESFDGRVDYIWPQIDPATRTVKVRCEFNNRRRMLNPGMFARVALSLPMGRRLVIPDGGVLRTGIHNVAFVDRGDGYLVPTEVELGPRVGREFIVLKGLQAGDRIVASANFLIDSESQLQAAIGAYAPPPGVSAPAQPEVAKPGAPAAATMEMTTDPSPLYRGRNQVKVALRDASGKPISGAQVSVTFYMAPMPAMGMAAIRVQANATESSPGLYTAAVELGSGGSWSVTLVAGKGGQTVATRQFDVSVGGPMSM